jgi:cell division protein FtsA
VFQLPVRRGGPIGVGGLVEVIGSPGYATAVGLAIYGSSMAEVLVAREEVAGSAGWLERVKRFLTDIF